MEDRVKANDILSIYLYIESWSQGVNTWFLPSLKTQGVPGLELSL